MMMVLRQEEKRVKVAGVRVIAYGKFQPSGISGEVTLCVCVVKCLLVI
jgi:hypothetical protein